MNHINQGKTDDIGTLLDHIQKLPSLPNVVMEIMKSIDNEKVDVTLLAEKIANDPAIVARVLRVANSPFFGLSQQIDSISRAIVVLGFNSLRGLVTGAAIINVFSYSEKNIDWQEFWRHSIGVAVCAKVLAKHTGLNQETAFTAGLLHDIGRLVMGIYFPSLLAQVLQFEDSYAIESLQTERDELGFDHAALGGEVAKRWHFPPSIQQAIRIHHTETRAEEKKSLSEVVHIADLFARTLNGGCLEKEGTERLAIKAWEWLGLENEKLEILAGEAQQLYDGAITLIGE